MHRYSAGIRYVVPKCPAFIVHKVRAVYDNAVRNKRPTYNRGLRVAVQRFSERFKPQGAAKASLIKGECLPAITGKGNEDGAHQASGISGSTSFINFSSDSCHPR